MYYIPRLHNFTSDNYTLDLQASCTVFLYCKNFDVFFDVFDQYVLIILSSHLISLTFSYLEYPRTFILHMKDMYILEAMIKAMIYSRFPDTPASSYITVLYPKLPFQKLFHY